MIEFFKGWIQRQMERAAFWPAVAVTTSIVWLFRSKCGIEEFNAWAIAAGVFIGILSGGVVANKRLNRPGLPLADATAADPEMNESQERPPA